MFRYKPIFVVAILLFAPLAADAAGSAKLQKIQAPSQPVQGGHGFDVMIYLTTKGDLKVQMQSSHPNIVPVPSQLVHFPKVDRKKVNLSINPVNSDTTVTISATYSGASVSTQVTVMALDETEYNITGHQISDLFQLAESKGFRFLTNAFTTRPSGARCKLNRAHKNGVLLGATVPSHTFLIFVEGGSEIYCKYSLFSGSASLRDGWRLKSLKWKTIPQGFPWSYDQPPQYTDDPTFRVQVTFGGSTVSRTDPPNKGLLLERVQLEGPAGASWQDAF